MTLLLLVIGAAGGWVESHDAGLWRAGDVRDGALGWSIVFTIVITSVAAVAVPMPWATVPGLISFALIGVFAVERPATRRPLHQPDDIA